MSDGDAPRSDDMDPKTANYFKKMQYTIDPPYEINVELELENFEEKDEIENLLVVPTSSPSAIANWQKATKGVRNIQRTKSIIERGFLHRMNTSVGFIPDDESEDRYHTMKIYVGFFAALGIISSVGIIVIGDLISKISIGPGDQTKAHFDQPVGLSLDSAGALDFDQVASYGWPLIFIGSMILIIGVIGCFAIYNEMFLYMSVYSALCLASTVVVTPIIITRLIRYEEFKEDVSGTLRMTWLAVSFLYPNKTQTFERDNSCCGWYNVFDYCSTKYMSSIMYDALVEGSIEDYMRKLENVIDPNSLQRAKVPGPPLAPDPPQQNGNEKLDVQETIDPDNIYDGYEYGQEFDYSTDDGYEYSSENFSSNDSINYNYSIYDGNSTFNNDSLPHPSQPPSPEKGTRARSQRRRSKNVCDSSNEYCVCNEAHRLNSLPSIFSSTCRDSNDSRIIVSDGCYQHTDIYGEDICVLNGCGDILNHKAVWYLIALLILSGIFVIGYTVGLYFNIILTMHYHEEYKLEIKKAEARTRFQIEAAKTREGLRKIGRSVSSTAAYGRSASVRLRKSVRKANRRRQKRFDEDEGSIKSGDFQSAPATPE